MAGRELCIAIYLFIFINVTSGWWLWSRHRCCSDIESGFCFKSRGVFSIAPECPSKYSPTFTLFTRNLSRSGIPISKDNIPFEFLNDRKTAFIVHGWTGSFSTKYKNLKNALLRKDDLNVIGVDWRRGASSPTYFPAAANTQSIGALLGATVNSLRSIQGSNPYFWCIGHSLGAHVCGFSSLTAQPLLERITGVDPAGPSFGKDKGLTKSSASHVDVIHTDPVFGSHHPRGHVDFYPNGGHNQPGCAVAPLHLTADSASDEEKVEALVTAATQRSEIVRSVGCSHQKSVTYMTNSVRYPSCYVAKKVCSDYKDIPGSCTEIPSSDQYGVMGYDAINHRYTGYLHFEPSLSSPHCSTN